MVFVKLKWVLHDSKGAALIAFENEEDPKKAIEMLLGQRLG